jgi:hypothetical protein
MNYALDVLNARQARDATVERARAKAEQRIIDLRHERDRLIREMKAENPLLSVGKIAAQLGCCSGTVSETLNPQRHDRANARRRAHWHDPATLEAQRARRRARSEGSAA